VALRLNASSQRTGVAGGRSGSGVPIGISGHRFVLCSNSSTILNIGPTTHESGVGFSSRRIGATNALFRRKLSERTTAARRGGGTAKAEEVARDAARVAELHEPRLRSRVVAIVLGGLLVSSDAGQGKAA
jgi:hypothetical protein